MWELKEKLSTICLLLSLTLVSGCQEGNGSLPAVQLIGRVGEGDKSEQLIQDGVIKAADLTKLPKVAINRKDTFIIGTPAPDGIFNPIYAEATSDMDITDALFEAMMQMNKDGTYSTALAERFVLHNKLIYTFTLKDGLKFSDGSPLTAEDVAFTLTVLHDKSYDGQRDIIRTAHIKGGLAYKKGQAATIDGIKVIDSRTIEITTTKPSSRALAAIGAIGILSKEYYGENYKQGDLSHVKDLLLKPIGSGSYKLDRFIAGQEAVLSANDYYYKGKPHIPNLIFKVITDKASIPLLQVGEIDMGLIAVSKDRMAQLKKMGFLDITLFPTNGYGYIALNHNREPFKDKRVRQALTYGLNRQQIVDAVYQGYADVIDIPQSKESWSYTSEVTKYNFDLEKAKQLLDEAGWRIGADGIREKNGHKFKIMFTAATPNHVNDVLIPIAQANYQQLGIEFMAEQMDYRAAVEKRKKGEFDMVFLAWQLTPDPQASLDIFMSGGLLNHNGYSNAKLDYLFTKADREVSLKNRKPIFKELYQELNEDLPYIYMYQRRDMWATNARIQGFDMSSYRRFTRNLSDLTIKG